MAKLKVLKNATNDEATYIQGDIVYPSLQETIVLLRKYPDSFKPLDKEAETAVEYLSRNK